jgi:phospholipase/carboxylesterase
MSGAFSLMRSKHSRTESEGVCVLEPQDGPAEGAIVWLHGLGDTFHGFADIMEHIVPYNIRCIIPNAPNRPVTMNGGMVMPAWFDMRTIGDRSTFSTEDLLQTREVVHALLDEQCELVGSKKVILGGFSQGGAVAVHAGLSYAQPLRALICHSGYVVGIDNYRKDNADPNFSIHPRSTRSPILAIHGEEDFVVPIELYDQSFGALEKILEDDVDFVRIPKLGHSLDVSTINLLRLSFSNFLAQEPRKKFN